MATPIKGDRDAKTRAAYMALDFAFNTRIASIFDLMTLQMRSDPDRAATTFVNKFIQATDAWNRAKAALDTEYLV
jgi:hypothetical protein